MEEREQEKGERKERKKPSHLDSIFFGLERALGPLVAPEREPRESSGLVKVEAGKKSEETWQLRRFLLFFSFGVDESERIVRRRRALFLRPRPLSSLVLPFAAATVSSSQRSFSSWQILLPCS